MTRIHRDPAAGPQSARHTRGRAAGLAVLAAVLLAGCYGESYDPPIARRTCEVTTGPGVDGLQLYGTNRFSGLPDIANYSSTATLDAGTIEFNNPALSSTSRTGSLRISLWAVAGNFNGGSFTGYSVGTYAIQFAGGATTLLNGQSADLVPQSVAAFTPPRGSYCVMLTLEEYNPASCPGDSDGYCIVDWQQFSTSAEFY